MKVTQTNAAKANKGSFQELYNQWKAAEAQLKNLSGTIQKNEDGTMSLTQEYKDQAAEVDKLKQTLLLFNAGIAQGNLNVGNYGNTLDGMRQKLKDLGVIIQTTDVGTEEFMKAREEAEKLSTEIQIAEGKIDSMGNKVAKNQIKDTFNDVTGATQALSGALGVAMLATGDNEEAQEKLRKVMGAVSLAQTALTIARQKDDIAQTAQLIKTKAASAAQAAYTVVVGTSTGALKAFRLALAATGIGAIVLVLYEAARAAGMFADSIDEVTEAEKRRLEFEQETRDMIDQIVGSMGERNREYERELDLMKSQGASAKQLYEQEKKILLDQQQQLQVALQNEKISTKTKLDLWNKERDVKYALLILDNEYATKVSENAKKRAEDVEKASERVNEALLEQMKEQQDLLDANTQKAWDYYTALNAAIAAAVSDSKKQFDDMGEEITDAADNTSNLIFESFKTNREKQKEESEKMTQEWLSYATSTADALAGVLGNAIGGSYETVKDFQRDLLKVALTALKNSFQLALAQGAFKEIASKGLAGILTSAITTLAIETAYNAAIAGIQGFATGGKIKGGQPIQRSNGDDVLITAKRGEVILNDGQQKRLERMGGRDIWGRLGVPGFADGGFVPRQISGEAAMNVNLSAMRDLQDVIRSMPAPVLTYKEFSQFERSVQMADSVSGL